MFPSPEELCPFKVRASSNRAFLSGLPVKKKCAPAIEVARKDFQHAGKGN